MGDWTLLLGLSALAFVAALALAYARRDHGRLDVLLSAGVLWNALVLAPIYALGLTDTLTASNLALASLVTSAAALAAAALARGPARLTGELARALRELARLPRDVARLFAGSGSPLWIGVPVVALVYAWLFVALLLAEPEPNWDGLWYHEPILAFAIQNQGFAMVDLPGDMQAINGMPRLCEMTGLWFGIFTGRTLVELPNLLFVFVGAAAVYQLAVRFSRDARIGVAFACVYALLPVNVRLIGTTLVDPHTGGLVLAAAYFATRPRLSLSDAWMAAVALALSAGTKHLALVPVAVFSFLVAARLLKNARALGSARALTTLLGGVVLIAGLAAETYVRNWQAFDNPIWPWGYESKSLDINWPAPRLKGQDLERDFKTHDWDELVEAFAAAPFHVTTRGPAGSRVDDYGPAGVFVVLPLGLLGCVLAAIDVFRRRRRKEERQLTASAVWLTLAVIAQLLAYPSLHRGRYYLPMVGMLVGTACWLALSDRGRAVLRHAAFAAIVLASAMVPWMMSHGWIESPREMLALIEASPEERRTEPKLGSGMVAATALAKAREIGPGDLVVFKRVQFLALLWNHDYSNRVVWAKRPFPVGREQKADWVVVPSGGSNARGGARSDRWERVGVVESSRGVRKTVAFRPASAGRNARATASPREARRPAATGPARGVYHRRDAPPGAARPTP